MRRSGKEAQSGFLRPSFAVFLPSLSVVLPFWYGERKNPTKINIKNKKKSKQARNEKRKESQLPSILILL